MHTLSTPDVCELLLRLLRTEYHYMYSSTADPDRGDPRPPTTHRADKPYGLVSDHALHSIITIAWWQEDWQHILIESHIQDT